MTSLKTDRTHADFLLVWDFFKSNGIVNDAADSPIGKLARDIHANTYSLILWKFVLPDLPEHGLVFLNEIASDALQVLPQTLMGYSKTAKLLIRGIIENTFRHIYYLDHRIEFARLNRDGKWYMNNEQLTDYAKIHPTILDTEPKYNAINQLTSLHSQLSVGVHGRSIRDMEMRASLRRIVYDETKAEAIRADLKKATQAANFLIAALHLEAVKNFQADERRILLRTMPPAARAVLSDLN